MSKTANPIEKISNQYADFYIAYTRKSTDDIDNQKNSIEYQAQEIKRDLARQGIEIAPLTIEGFCTEGYITEHHSGFKEDSEFETNPDGTISISVDRPKFLMLVNLLRQKKFKGVISLCWDRFSRNEADDMLTKKLLKQGIDVRFVQVKYDSSSSGALHMDIDGMFSRHYSRTISEKVRNTNKKLRSEGKCLYNPSLGYISLGSANKPFDPERAPLVKRIFELYATGEWSFNSLADWANKQGLTTRPTRRNRTKEEKLQGLQLQDLPKVSRPVTAKTIENILHNPFYIGKIKHKGEIFDSTAHQPLIDVGLFYKVQSLIKQKNVNVHYPDLAFFTYRGLIKCGICQRIYSPYTQKGISYYRSQCKKGCPNTVKNVNDNFISGKVQEIIGKIHFTDEEIRTIEEDSQTEIEKLQDSRNKQLDDLRFQYNKAVDNLDFLLNDKLNLLRTGLFTPAQIIEEEGRLKSLIKDFQNKMSAYSESTQAMLDFVISFSELAKYASIYYPYALDTEKQRLVVETFSELFIEHGELKYKAKQGYDALLSRHCAKSTNSCAEGYLILELERIYHLLKSRKPILETIINNTILPRPI